MKANEESARDDSTKTTAEALQAALERIEVLEQENARLKRELVKLRGQTVWASGGTMSSKLKDALRE